MSKIIVRVIRPELSPEEKKQRYAEIKAAATQLLLAVSSKKG